MLSCKRTVEEFRQNLACHFFCSILHGRLLSVQWCLFESSESAWASPRLSPAGSFNLLRVIQYVTVAIYFFASFYTGTWTNSYREKYACVYACSAVWLQQILDLCHAVPKV